MNFLLQFFISYLLLYRYITLFGVTFLAALALPIPSAATVMASAAFAGQGYFNPLYVFIVAVVGNVLGDNVGYWLTRLYGKKIVYRVGLRKITNSELFNAIEKRINHWPGVIIFLSRFEVIATLSVNFISGLGKMPYQRYLMYEIPGEIAQVLMYGSIGYVFGNNWQNIDDSIGQLWLVVTPTAALLIFFYWKKIVHWIIQR